MNFVRHLRLFRRISCTETNGGDICLAFSMTRFHYFLHVTFEIRTFLISFIPVFLGPRKTVKHFRRGPSFSRVDVGLALAESRSRQVQRPAREPTGKAKGSDSMARRTIPRMILNPSWRNQIGKEGDLMQHRFVRAWQCLSNFFSCRPRAAELRPNIIINVKSLFSSSPSLLFERVAPD